LNQFEPKNKTIKGINDDSDMENKI